MKHARHLDLVGLLENAGVLCFMGATVAGFIRPEHHGPEPRSADGGTTGQYGVGKGQPRS